MSKSQPPSPGLEVDEAVYVGCVWLPSIGIYGCNGFWIVCLEPFACCFCLGHYAVVGEVYAIVTEPVSCESRIIYS